MWSYCNWAVLNTCPHIKYSDLNSSTKSLPHTGGFLDSVPILLSVFLFTEQLEERISHDLEFSVQSFRTTFPPVFGTHHKGIFWPCSSTESGMTLLQGAYREIASLTFLCLLSKCLTFSSQFVSNTQLYTIISTLIVVPSIISGKKF